MVKLRSRHDFGPAELLRGYDWAGWRSSSPNFRYRAPDTERGRDVGLGPAWAAPGNAAEGSEKRDSAFFRVIFLPVWWREIRTT